MNPAIIARLRLSRADFSLDVNLALPGRGVSVLFGASGSGKTSCLRALAGLEPEARGTVQVFGQTWQDSDACVFVPTHQRPIGYVFQEASLFAHLSVRDNLLFGYKRIPKAQRHIQLDQACELLGIGHLLDRRPQHLSGGERQRAGIARALLTSPRLLLMDEPLASLDAPRKREILPYLARLHEALDLAIVYVTHSREEVARLADHLVLLEQGRVVDAGPAPLLLSRLDSALAEDEDAAVLVDGEVQGFDARYGLLDLGLPGGQRLRLAHAERAPGSRLRVQVQARDVSLSLTPDSASSILNRLPATVVAIRPSDNPAQLLVALDAGGTALMARITRFSGDQLGLAPGQALWAQIKSVAVLA